jgi:hypothetical protein
MPETADNTPTPNASSPGQDTHNAGDKAATDEKLLQKVTERVWQLWREELRRERERRK